MDCKFCPFSRSEGLLSRPMKAIVLILLFNVGPFVRTEENPGEVGVCESLDIRNSITEFSKLKNCSVIEGKLSILLMHNVSAAELEKLSFPKLVEITDYLLLFRVQNLKTLRNLFPNLAVIRGQNLMYTYSLVAFEMPHLEEIGLVNLTLMERGAVRLEKNPNLCFTQTVDWTRIAKSAKPDDHYIRENKNVRDCLQFCPDNCKATQRSKDDKTKVKRCWTVNDCQKVCDDPNCDYCDANGACCSPHCVGGCTGRSASECIACKKVVYKNICQPRCPQGTYLFQERRCLTRQQCIEKSNCQTYKLVDGLEDEHPSKCVVSCPKGYTEQDMKCVKCEVGKCPKFCTPAYIDSVASAQRFKDCTVIQGPLVIQLLGGTNIGQELEESLGQIERVTHFIKITHSYPLLSFHFFKSLKTIHGDQLVSDQFALYVLENQNLQELFHPDVQKKLKIDQGIVFFHFNRKLCYNKIEEFVDDVGLRMADLKDWVSTQNNGDQATCSMEKLILNVSGTAANNVILRWNNFVHGDQRQLLRYVVNIRESNGKDMDIHQGRDACTVVWKTEDINPSYGKNDTNVYHLVGDLKPYTMYAVYVETYMISGASTGAMSDIVYFRTHPKAPEEPDNLRAQADSHTALTVKWDPPKNPNGNVTHYKIYWKPRDTPSMMGLDRKDFCKEPWVPPEDHVEKEEEAEKVKQKNISSVDGQPCCACPKSKKLQEKEEQDRQLQIQFENSIHDTVFKKRMEELDLDKNCPSRHKRDVTTFFSTESPFRALYDKSRTTPITTPLPSPVNTTTENSNASFQHLMADVFATHYTITNLRHFTEYSIEIMACQEIDPPTKIGKCGVQAFVTARTAALKSADDVPLDSIEASVINNKTINLIKITWLPPPQPNGFVITYELEYRRAKDDHQASIVCIRQQDFTKTGGYDFKQLVPGNYSYRVRSSSLAGPGDWTDAKYFIVPEPGEPPTEAPIIMIVISVVVIVVIIIFIVMWFCAKSRLHPPYIVSENPDYIGIAYTPDEWEVDRDKISLIKELGQGSFGMVYEGEYADGSPNGPRMVAVKTLNENATMSDRCDFLQEATNMKKFVCHHVVRLIGVVSKTQPTFVIMELMANGDLKNFLRKHRPDDEDNCGRQLQVKEILQMAGEIADGMAYLGFKKFVHRDLAARNCMVAADNTVKIGDFGMTRDIYETDYYRKQGKGLLPVRWMPPESLKDGKYSYESDVWSYGVVLWEMATLAAQPYQGLANEQVLRYVLDGKIMEKPEGCPDQLYDLMLLCWQFKPKQRPTFLDIIERLIPDLNPSFKNVSYFFSNENNPDNREMYTEECEDQLLDGDIDTAHIPLTNSLGELEPLQYEMRVHRPANDISPHSEDGRRAEEAEAGACADPARRVSVSSNPTSAISSNGDSKGSSKSSTGSYAHRNGLANGHGPFPQTTLC
ncbi:insulin-like peptide receptor isoform X2 [Liolophura sinensis]|uniref:insulin-like peptide receptor isoform X2 n=1 Tax=Liolophura sinensis TaxID=3198878 RepID=UPI00315906D9